MAAPLLVHTAGRGLFSTLLGGVLGGAAVTSLAVPDSIKMMFGYPSNGSGHGSGTGNGAGNDVSAMLFAQIADLKASMANRSAVTIVSPSGGASKVYTVVWVAAGAGAGYCLLRWSGRGLLDVVWVTKAAFKQGIDHLTTGLDGLSTRLNDVRTALALRIDALGLKQDQTMKAQEDMGEALGNVGCRVGVVQETVSTMQESIFSMKSKVESLEHKLDAVTVKQDDAQQMLQYSNRGIHLLCGVVSHSLAESGNHLDAARDLRAFAGMSPLSVPLVPQSCSASVDRALTPGAATAAKRDPTWRAFMPAACKRANSESSIAVGDDAA